MIEKTKQKLKKTNRNNNENSSVKTEEKKNVDSDGDVSQAEDQSSEGGLSIAEKQILGDRVQNLSADGLASLVRLVQKEKPQAIDDLDRERMQITIKKLDKKTYDQINQ